MKTKLIKAIQRIQKKLMIEPIVEEVVEEIKIGELRELENDSDDTDEESESRAKTRMETEDQNNPYRGIKVEKVINIDKVFKKTCDGRAVMETLKSAGKADDRTLSKINKVLCEFLRANYGVRPSSFYKNMTALSLVESYPQLRSSTPDIPQALWFHAHARGKNRHTGRIHYHLEYLVRKSNDRIIQRTKNGLEQSATTEHSKQQDIIVDDAVNIQDMTTELKFIYPSPNTRARIMELWAETFTDRDVYRKNGFFDQYLREYPVTASFDGEMITLDFQRMFPNAPDFWTEFDLMQAKVLRAYPDLLKHITNNDIRTLGIIRLKNPSRGMKRNRNTSHSKDNPLMGIVEWIQADDPIPQTMEDNPMLYIRGEFPDDGGIGIVAWKSTEITIEP
ncbi:uncharacterized protein LOC131687270 [Topomyia yanbarensis]|uniref:uncharacterized protein LOC131687270 n=1 Tax=Topomyia yanbarensis TaxID=2498891 RepID=UPI00273BB30D|nr:uncharacterized protein LOC131687270 [Topomyia yanbarensis]